VKGSTLDLAKKLIDLVQLKGIHALRVSQLYDGQNGDNLKIPPIELFTRNNYKQHQIEDISVDRL
jgi:hypothetical protein